MNIQTVIFDLGGVLIDWNPEYVFLDEFDGNREKMNWFFENICTSEWNEQQDAGTPYQQATEERVRLFPEYEKHIRMYYGRWEEMLGNAIAGSVEILNKLRNAEGIRLIALTNWSHETFPIALDRFDFLGWFEGIVVSGEEKMIKPQAAIYNLTLDRYQIDPNTAVFIDDRKSNVDGAIASGMKGIHFQSPEQLKNELIKMNLSCLKN
ncbi:MAG: HAD family phosphatase [Flavobacteriaceae bacterium]|nr:HAD family phosphatase [Flavobacteriaceae bacterium]MDG2313900.1 HAD family phosphatase [Flavobacteriaceae bacterium]